MSPNSLAIVPDDPARHDVVEDALQLQQEQLHLLIDALPALISYVDSEQRYQFTNKGYEEWFGHSRDEVCGKHLIEILGTAAYETIRPHVEQVLAGNKVSFASWLDYKGAGQRHVQINYEPQLDEQGNVRGFLAFIVDLSERKRAEEATRESEELSRAILSSFDTHVAVLDRQGKIIAVNSAWNDFARDNGLRNDDLVGAGVNYLEVCRKAVNSGDAQVQNALAGIKAVCEGSKEHFRLEYPCHSPTRRRWFLMLVTPLKRSEGGAVVAHNDITERKRAEEELRESKERFQRLVETTNVIGWEADLETWSFTYVSPQVTKLLGYESAEWYEKDFWTKHLHPEDRDFAINFCAESSKQLTEYEFEYRMIAADGHTVWLRDLVSVVSDGNGKTALRGYLIDITEQKQIEKSRRHLAERLEFAREDERRSLARHLHDEACQDLAAAAIYLEQLGQKLSRLLPEEVSVQGDLVKVGNLIQLTHETLRRTARALHPSILEHYGLVTALRSFTQELSMLSQRSGVVFEMEASPNFPRLHRMVETAAYRIAQEAITNAFKHAQARKISVKLTLEDDMASIVVEDDGRGIDYGSIQASHGIGLAAMHERAELIGAKVEISTKLTEGTRLALKLPLTETR